MGEVNSHIDLLDDTLPKELPFTLRHYTSGSLPADLFEACFNLIELTSGDAYRASLKGWSSKAKKAEMKDKEMHYVVLLSKQNPSTDSTESDHIPAESKEQSAIEGFVSYMLTTDDGVPVIYIYEIHLAASARGRGIGKALMDCIDKIGKHEGMEKAMLTVFVSNVDAIRFYTKLGYEKWDEEYIPPRKRLRSHETEERKPSYIIMAKTLTENDGWETEGDDEGDA